MKIRDKKLGQTVSVCDAQCPTRSCYWPRQDPGSFTQGRGYRSRPGPQEWLCGTRAVNGCPTGQVCRAEKDGEKCDTANLPGATHCSWCRAELPPETTT